MKIMTLSAFICSLTLSPLFAAPPPTQPTCPASCNCDNQAKQIVLSPEQKTKIMNILSENTSSHRAIQIQLDALREQIEALVSGDRLDEKSLDILTQKQASLLAQRMKTRALSEHQIYSILTPEQKTHFKQIHQFWKFKNEDLNQLQTY
jgi:protein CpxP